MEESKTLQEGQSAISCHLCEGDFLQTKIHWKCLDCDLLLCTVCKEKRHSKFKKASYHTIINLKESNLSDVSAAQIDFSDTFCDLHTKNGCCALCATCKKLVCVKCITKAHNGHDLVDEDEYNNTRKELKEKQMKVDEDLNDIKQNQDQINKVRQEEHGKYEKAIGDILRQRKRFQEFAYILIDKLEQRHQTINEVVDTEQKKFELKKKELEEKVLDSKDLLDCEDLITFYEKVDEMKGSLNTTNIPLTLNFEPLPIFRPGRIDVKSVGVLTEELSRTTKLNVLKEFNSDLSYIHYIAECRDGTFWIGDNRSEKLQHVTLTDDGIQILLTVNTRIFGMTVSLSNELFLSVGDSMLKKVDKRTGEMNDSVYSVAPLKSILVHITHDNHVIIGALSLGKVFPVSGRRVVVVMDQAGNHKREYEVDNNYKRLFHYPERICTTITGNIFVVDIMEGNGKGRVVVLNEEGDVMNVFTGHSDVNTKEQPFKPGEITDTTTGQICVTDCWNNTIHVLSNLGESVSYLNTKDIGIQYPFSVVCTDNQQLYIGCISCKDTADNGKLYEVEFSS